MPFTIMFHNFHCPWLWLWGIHFTKKFMTDQIWYEEVLWKWWPSRWKKLLYFCNIKMSSHSSFQEYYFTHSIIIRLPTRHTKIIRNSDYATVLFSVCWHRIWFSDQPEESHCNAGTIFKSHAWFLTVNILRKGIYREEPKSPGCYSENI